MRLALLCFAFLISTAAWGQKMWSRNYTVNDGLPSNTVRAVLKDRNGVMWIGTASGLCKFDGKDFFLIEAPAGNKSFVSGDYDREFSYGPIYYNRDKVSSGSSGATGSTEGSESPIYTGHNHQKLSNGIWLQGDAGLASGNIFSLTEDGHGNLWIGSKNGGLTLFNGRQFTHYTTAHGLVSNEVRLVWYSKQFDLLFIGTDNGCSVFDGIRFRSLTDHSTGNSSNELNFLYILSFADATDHVAIMPYGYGDHIYSYFPSQGTFVRNVHPADWMLTRPSVPPVVLQNGDRVTGWIRHGLKVFRKDGVEEHFPKMGQIFNVSPGEASSLYIAAWAESPANKAMPGGLFIYENSQVTDISNRAGISNYGIWTVYYDAEWQILWVGTLLDGMYKVPVTPFEWFTEKELFSDKRPPFPKADQEVNDDDDFFYEAQEEDRFRILSLLSTRDSLLIVGETNRIFAVGKDHKATSLNIEPLLRFKAPMEFRSMAEDSEGNLYTGIHIPFITKFPKGEDKNYGNPLLLPSKQAADILAIDEKDVVWYGNKWDESVGRMDLRSGDNILMMPHGRNTIIYSGARGDTIWYYSAYEGLMRSVDGSFERLKDKEHDLPEIIRDFCFDRKYNLYLGTNGGDLWILSYNASGVHVKDIIKGGDYNERPEHYTPLTLIGNSIRFVEADRDGNIWVGTNMGLNRLTPQGTTCFYTTSEGYHDFTSNTATIDHNGDLWIGTDNALCRVNSSMLQQPGRKLPALILTGMDINLQPSAMDINLQSPALSATNNRATNKKDHRHLAHDDHNLIFHFATNNYLNPESDLYRFKLDGFSELWSPYSTDTRAIYTSLNPGTYTFTVEAFNLTDSSSSTSVSFTFVILKPWWLQWWFIILSATMLITSALLLVYMHNRRVKRQNEQKLEEVKRLAKLEMKLLRSQMNPHFIFNCINSIQGLVLQNKSQLAARYLRDFSKLLRLTLNNATRDFITLDEELQYTRHYLNLEQMRFDNNFKIDINVDEDLDQNLIMIPPMLIQPHIENAIFHGLIPSRKSEKILNISFAQSEGLFTCTIEDNGIGRGESTKLKENDASNHSPLSTAITNERIEILNNTFNTNKGHIHIVDLFTLTNEAAGTRVEIGIPI